MSDSPDRPETHDLPDAVGMAETNDLPETVDLADTVDLAGAIDLPEAVRLVTGAGGLPVVEVRDERYGALDVLLHGAHVTSWVPAGAAPVLWLSPTSAFRSDAAIRGGVPICFPWFGGGPRDDLKPAHGYARLRDWKLESATSGPEGVEVVLTLPAPADATADTPANATADARADARADATTDAPVGPALPGVDALAATFRVRLGETLSMTLDVRNTGEKPVTFEEALHTYLAVSDVRSIAVEGLAGALYVDRNGGPEPVRQDEDVIRFAGETDRIYPNSAAEVVVDDPGARRAIAVRKAGSSSTVVWNPWSDKAASMSDLDGWDSMVCVETANVRSDAVTLAAGATHEMTAILEVRSRR